MACRAGVTALHDRPSYRPSDADTRCRSGLAVSSPDCGVTGPRFESHREPVSSLPALGPWEPPPSRTGPLASLQLIFAKVKAASWGPLNKKKNPGALGTCPVCPWVKTALPRTTVFIANATLICSLGHGLRTFTAVL